MIAMEHRVWGKRRGDAVTRRRGDIQPADSSRLRSEVRRQRKTGKFFAATSGLYRLDRFLLVR